MIGEEQQQKITEIAKKRRLSLVVLFGSQATGRSNAKSDIDIAVLPRDVSVLSHVTEEIGDVFGRNDVEVADLSVPSPYLWHAVAKEGVLIFEGREGLFSDWKVRAMNVWYDTAPLRARQKAALRSWADAQTT